MVDQQNEQWQDGLPILYLAQNGLFGVLNEAFRLISRVRWVPGPVGKIRHQSPVTALLPIAEIPYPPQKPALQRPSAASLSLTWYLASS